MTIDITRVGVLGCGLMGAGIAEVCTRAGAEVVVVESDADALARGRSRLTGSLDRA
ncbi:MAG: 3-hydroxyacyl-CoA dehydrogenase NAD-binding domain-containing protein, partial [Actinomycetota bacterium]|nr:3-hydroxyacyl-CoA dehydrogenase NAD-binding domain-containing protein [Actinomycetota bacterium]